MSIIKKKKKLGEGSNKDLVVNLQLRRVPCNCEL